MAFNPMDIGPESIPNDTEILRELEITPEGDKIFEVIDTALESEQNQDTDFYRNLAHDLSDSDLGGLAETLVDEIDSDLQARQKWDKDISVGLKHLGFTIEEFRSEPFMRACSSFDTTLSSALYSAWATMRAELLPDGGITNADILGKDDDALIDRAERVKKFLNHYLKLIDKPYYSDSDINFIWTAFTGNGFKKVWQDPILCRPLSRLISPLDIIVDPNATSILNSSRITQKFKLTRQEIILKEESGEFVDVALREMNDLTEQSISKKQIKRMDGVASDSSSNKNVFDYYECHVIRHISSVNNKGVENKDEFPLPYIATIDIQSRKVVKLIRNWRENDNKFQRKECFVHYKYLPGFGLYGYGILHLIGSNSIALTSILRQAVDAGTFANFPAFVRVKGLKMEQNDKWIGPGEAIELETGGSVRIQDAIMPLPYKGADATLMMLRKELREESKQPAGVAETQISDKHTDAAVGTILALIEKSTVIQSSVMRCLHNAFSHELQLIYDCFVDYMGDEPFNFKIKGEEIRITKEDFDGSIQIVPVSDANMDTFNQRMIKSYALLQIAQANPQLHDMREIYHRVYLSMGIKDIDKILKTEKEAIPLDPISENMNSLEGKPLKAALWQDHQSHIVVHSSSPNAETPDMKAHMQVHFAMDYYLRMQKEMGVQLPSLEEMAQNPDLQNQISLQATEAAQKLTAEKQNAQGQSVEQLMAMDIEQRREAARLKNEETKMKIEADSAKAGLQFQTEMEKLKAQKEMAEEKNEKEIQIAEMKQKENYGLTALKSLFSSNKRNREL